MSKTEQITEAAFDAFLLDETSAIDIELPNGEPMLYQGEPVRIHIHGPATDRFVKAQSAMQREATKRVMAAMAKKGKGKADPEDDEADAKFLAAITDRVENFPYPGGADAIYRERRLKYIADQVRAYVNDLGNFFKR